jgi:hypothetical protein
MSSSSSLLLLAGILLAIGSAVGQLGVILLPYELSSQPIAVDTSVGHLHVKAEIGDTGLLEYQISDQKNSYQLTLKAIFETNRIARNYTAKVPESEVPFQSVGWQFTHVRRDADDSAHFNITAKIERSPSETKPRFKELQLRHDVRSLSNTNNDTLPYLELTVAMDGYNWQTVTHRSRLTFVYELNKANSTGGDKAHQADDKSMIYDRAFFNSTANATGGDDLKIATSLGHMETTTKEFPGIWVQYGHFLADGFEHKMAFGISNDTLSGGSGPAHKRKGLLIAAAIIVGMIIVIALVLGTVWMARRRRAAADTRFVR